MTTMESNEIIMPIVTAIVGGVAGWAAKFKAAKSEAVEAVEQVQKSLQTHIEFTDRMLENLRVANTECEERAKALTAKVREQDVRIDELDVCVRTLSKIPPKPNRNGN